MSLSRGTWEKVAKLRRLAGAERRLLLRAGVLLPLVDLGLRVLGFTRVRRLLARGTVPVAEAPAAAEGRNEAETLAWAVAVAARHHLYPMKCLPRSLVLWRMLARRGIPSELCIGVRHDERGFRAHAWVEHAGRPLGEGEDGARPYAPLALPPA